MNNPKLWFSLYDFSFDYKGVEPSYIDESFAWSVEFEANWQVVLAELNLYLENHQPESYFNTTMVNTENSWKTISLKWWNIEFRKRQHFFPRTMEIVGKYPEIISLSFNQLEPNGKILPHCGDTNAIYRCHLGLDVPASLPVTGIRVKEEMRSWSNGKWLIFMDAYNHEAFNLSDQKRIIMVVDVLRPEFQSQKRKVISVVLTSLFLQKRAQQLKLLYKMPHGMIRFVSFLLRPLAYLGLKLVNLLKVY